MSDIIERNRAEEALAVSQRLLRDITDNSPSLIYALDPQGRFLLINRRLESVLGVPRESLIGKTREAILPGEIAAAHRDNDLKVMEGPGAISIEEENAESDGKHTYLSVKFPLVDHQGRVYGIGGVSTDITKRKRAEMHLHKLNRIYAVLSDINQTIVRERRPQAIFETACRISVEKGGFRMAWIGMFDRRTMQVNPVASAGETGDYLEKLNIALDDGERGRGPTATVIRGGEHVVANDIANDLRMSPWRADALRLGYRSSAAFPLTVAGEVRGTLTLYASEPDFFDADEIKLLDEMAVDIAFSLEISEQEEKRRQAEEQLTRNLLEMTTLNSLARQIAGGISRDRIVDVSLSEITKIIHPDLVFFFLKSGEDLELLRFGPADSPFRHESTPLLRVGECLCGIAVRDGKPVYSTDIYADPRCTWDKCKKAGLRSVAALPLLSENQVIGIFCLASSVEVDFKKHGAFLEAYSGEIALGLKNALLLEEAKKHGAELEKEVAERKQAEQDARHAFHRLRRFVDANIIGVVIANPSGDIIEANDYYLRTIGYTREEFEQGMVDWRAITPPEWISADERAIEELRKQGICTPYEKEYVRRDGTRVSVFLSDAMLPGPEEQIAAFVLDITRRKTAEAERNKLLSAIEQTGDVIVITDSEGTIRYVNPAFETVTGYTRDEAIGQNPRFLKSGEQDIPFYRKLWKTISDGHTWKGRLVNKKKDGSRYIEAATISPVCDPSGRIASYVSVKRDITETLRLEAQYQQAQKMESVGRLAGGVAHDYNNILGVIIGYAELAMAKVEPNSKIFSDLMEILSAAQRSADITRQLLAFARKQTISPRVLDLNKIVRGMIKMLRQLIGEDIHLVFNPGADLWPVRVDSTQIDQILANLCVNARDAIEGVGRVEIATSNASFNERPRFDHTGFIPGEYVLLTVTDTGCGMDRETIDHIFEPFFTTKGEGKGTGLGLATVYGIVKQNNGFIDVGSEPGRGSTFNVFIPRHTCRVEETRTESALEIPLGRGETVLVVEDEPAIRKMSRLMLEKLGYRVIEAGKPKDAIQSAEENTSEIHLLLTDVVMPDMNGYDLSSRLRNIRPTIKTLFMSGYSADVLAPRGVLDEGVNFIKKPFSTKDLAEKVRETLDS